MSEPQAWKSYSRRLKKLSAIVNEIKSEKKHAQKGIEQAEDDRFDAEQSLSVATEALTIVQELTSSMQNHAQAKIAGVVTQCLRVFGDYSFRIEFDSKRGSTAATFILTKGGDEVDPMECGGGIIDVIAFALRVAVMMARKPLVRQTLILDEPFKFVSANFRDDIAKVVETLSEQLNVQFVIVTHIPELMIGKVIEL